MTQQFKLVSEADLEVLKQRLLGFTETSADHTATISWFNSLSAAPYVAGDAVACEPIYYTNDDGDTWYDSPDDIDFIDALDPPEIGAEYELHVAYKNAIRTYKVTKVPDEISDDYEVELVSHSGPIYYTAPQPNRTAELEDNVKRLVEAITLTIEENLYLADGENCTLHRLNTVIAEIGGEV